MVPVVLLKLLTQETHPNICHLYTHFQNSYLVIYKPIRGYNL
ncbi:hypothetical protein HanRHA438_Chr17g0808641 [Helianthus annuus]|nr:hypothetical protein HanRHA438_Chr17g0808641 [Helianthus annuus]